MHEPWYSEHAGFFGPTYLVGHADYLTDARTVSEVDFLETHLPLHSPALILDVPCGHGRHAIEFAKRGYVVTGQDLSGVFVNLARRDAYLGGVSATFLQGDMRRLPAGPFDVVINLFTSFGYFVDETDDQAFLCAVAAVLRPGGTFVLDFVNRERVMANWTQHNWGKLTNGTVVVNDRSFDVVTGIEHNASIHYSPDGTVTKTTNRQRLYTLRELVMMCERAGLSCQETFGDFDGSAVSLTSPRAILFAKKALVSTQDEATA